MKSAKTSLKLVSTVDPNEIAHFSSHSSDWWDRYGTYAPLHKMGAARMSYIKDALGGDLTGKSILDIGCGGGLICEPMARLGAKVTGIDADQSAIKVATAHAKAQKLDISYFCGAAEILVKERKKFDAITALEILEHVSSPLAFVDLCAQLLKPEGKVIFSTLNRTWKSYGLGIFLAERVLSWAPPNTHQWNKFIRPSELSRMVEASGMNVESACGLAYRPLQGEFALHPHDLDINYFMVATLSK
ncbi:MAG: bifunctional 2-polyprenyl-6-hydroxyphenol methylase/3-demethylubiquinol 3-O-methyltransferase UbiG [Alphaproteobacteria bacterium]|nr:bifunctional 2-polyprenyl-6-hydroxyphenol methylase/3-demethylubiquinol 3-O-methyltransferase UbiG [Alphaproteobacteria bacterium]